MSLSTGLLREDRAQTVRPVAHPATGGLRRFIDSQRALSEEFDRHLPRLYQVDGQQDFVASMIPRFLHRGATVYEVGGGKHPSITMAVKQRLGLRVIGLDISGSELAAAPRGVYDDTLVGDICGFEGAGDGDIIICKGVLEHVKNAECAFQGLTSLLKPGGVALIFVPSRNSAFSHLNRLLPERLKRRLLFAIFPHKKTDSGFPAWYDRCTPRQFRAMARANRMMVIDENHYYRSSYFSFFFPLYLVWRFWVMALHAVVGPEAAETFTMALVKTP